MWGGWKNIWKSNKGAIGKRSEFQDDCRQVGERVQNGFMFREREGEREHTARHLSSICGRL
jgi:hypothetical protein